MTISNFEDMEIWQFARELCRAIYQVTKSEDFQDDLRFRSQIRAAGSIMDNIAEGFEREDKKNLYNFCILQRVLVEKFVVNYIVL